MRKLLGLLFCFAALTSSAQLKLGIDAGYDIAQFSTKGSDAANYSLSAINGYHIGLIGENKLSKDFFLTEELQFAHKGGIVNKSQTISLGSNYTAVLNYISVPVMLNLKSTITKSSKLIIGAGLYGAVGISGKRNGYDNTFNLPINDKIDFSNNTDNTADNKIKPIDLGYTFAAGIEWKKYQFKLNYVNSFTNIKPNGSTKFYNQSYGISAAYLLPW